MISARNLPLSNLGDAMKEIFEKYLLPKLDQSRIDQFQKGVYSLVKLNSDLKTLIDEHDILQNIDDEIRMITLEFAQYLNELDFSWWSDLKQQTERVFKLDNNTWLDLLKEECYKLDIAISNNKPPDIQKQFPRFSRQAGKYFFKTDTDLKRMCEELRSVGQQMNLRLEMIH